MRSTFLALLFLTFQYTLWVGQNSVWKALVLNQSVLLQQEKNQQLLMKNLRLKREISALQQNPLQSSSLAEDYMRWKLGLVKDGEWFCHLQN